MNLIKAMNIINSRFLHWLVGRPGMHIPFGPVSWVVSGSSTPDSSTPDSSTFYALQLLIASHKQF